MERATKEPYTMHAEHVCIPCQGPTKGRKKELSTNDFTSQFKTTPCTSLVEETTTWFQLVWAIH